MLSELQFEKGIRMRKERKFSLDMHETLDYARDSGHG